MKPSPPTDFCRQIRRTGTTLERHHPRPQRKPRTSCETLISPAFARRSPPRRRAVRMRAKPILPGSVHPSTAGETGLWIPPLAQRNPESIRADRSETKDDRMANATLLGPCRTPHCRQPAAAKGLESPPLRLLPMVPFGIPWALACRTGLGSRSHAFPRRKTHTPENRGAFHRFVILWES